MNKYIAAGAIFCFLGRGHLNSQPIESQPGNDQAFYEKLANECKKKQSKNCCLASVKAMMAGGYSLVPPGGCPVGYKASGMRCIDSYHWCEPLDAAISWKPYENKKYRYRVQYPSDWKLGSLAEKPSPEAVRFQKVTTLEGKYLNDAAIDILIEPNPGKKAPTKKWYQEWVKQLPGEPDPKIEIEETAFKNLKALKVAHTAIFFARGPDMFRIQWQVAGDYDEGILKSAQQVFEKMQSSFEFER